MILGITGNTRKEKLWHPVADLVRWLDEEGIAYCLNPDVRAGLRARKLIDHEGGMEHAGTWPRPADVMLSFGGDGTLLNSAHEIGDQGIPILGINIGRLGFLADVEVGKVQETVRRLLQGDYRIESRMVLEATVDNGFTLNARWALNEFVLLRSGETGMISIEVTVDGAFLNTYWADGLIIATPTGSTAYSLSVGGPILVPGCGSVVLTPIAPHTLTARPIILPDTAIIEARVLNYEEPYVFNADGKSTVFAERTMKLTVQRARHTVNLVKFSGQHFFQTLRTKLMWGMRKG